MAHIQQNNQMLPDQRFPRLRTPKHSRSKDCQCNNLLAARSHNHSFASLYSAPVLMYHRMPATAQPWSHQLIRRWIPLLHSVQSTSHHGAVQLLQGPHVHTHTPNQKQQVQVRTAATATAVSVGQHRTCPTVMRLWGNTCARPVTTNMPGTLRRPLRPGAGWMAHVQDER